MAPASCTQVHRCSHSDGIIQRSNASEPREKQNTKFHGDFKVVLHSDPTRTSDESERVQPGKHWFWAKNGFGDKMHKVIALTE